MNPKTKKRILLFSIALTVLILATYVISTVYVKTNTNKLYNETENYLIKNRGYKKSEISNIEVTHSFLSRMLSYDEWNIDVTFKDEPTAKYSYSYNNNNKIAQDGSSGRLDDGIYDHSEYPDTKNIRIAGKYIKNYGYTIFKVSGEVDRYKLDKSMLQSAAYKQIWNVQEIKPEDYFGKEIVVMGFNVRNHPLQKSDVNAKNGVQLYVMIVDDKAIGGYSLPIVDTIGGCYSIDGKVAEEIIK